MNQQLRNGAINRLIKHGLNEPRAARPMKGLMRLRGTHPNLLTQLCERKVQSPRRHQLKHN